MSGVAQQIGRQGRASSTEDRAWHARVRLRSFRGRAPVPLVAALVAALGVAPIPARADEPQPPPAEAVSGGGAPVETVVPTFREGPPDETLVRGPVPLLRRDAAAFAALVEEAFELTLSGKLRSDLIEGLRVDFRALDPRGRQRWLELTDPYERLREDARRKRAEQVEAGLQAFRLGLDERMRVRPQVAPHVLVARILKRHGVTAWPGNPPVTGEAEDVYLDALAFFGILGRNEEIVLSEGQEQVLREHLRAHFVDGPKADREAIESLPRLWRHVRARWQVASPTTRADLRIGVVRLMGQLPPPGRQVIVADSVGGDDATYAHWAARVRAAHDRFAALTDLGRNPRHVVALLRSSLGIEGTPAASTLDVR